MNIQNFQKIRYISCYLTLCFKIIQILKIPCDVEIFAIINTSFQIPSIPYFAEYVSLRSQMKDMKQNCLFAACFSRQYHYSVIVRDVIIFSLQNTYKNYKGRLENLPHHNNSNLNQLVIYNLAFFFNTK